VNDYTQATAAKGSLLAPMPGRIVQVLVKQGQKVAKGEPLMILEAMKMEVCWDHPGVAL
jgi:biotin carboxyl carrier protein